MSTPMPKPARAHIALALYDFEVTDLITGETFAVVQPELQLEATEAGA